MKKCGLKKEKNGQVSKNETFSRQREEMNYFHVRRKLALFKLLFWHLFSKTDVLRWNFSKFL